jgi:hypothetical protein
MPLPLIRLAFCNRRELSKGMPMSSIINKNMVRIETLLASRTKMPLREWDVCVCVPECI